VVICLERGADLHVAQLMPLPLIVSCFSKIQIGGFTFLVPAHPGVVPDKGPLNMCARQSLDPKMAFRLVQPFCRASGCDQQTDRHTGHTSRVAVVCI